MTDEAREAQRILQSLRHINGRLADIMERIERYKDSATRLTQSGGRNGSGGRNRSRVESGVIGMVDLEAKLSADQALLIARREEIRQAINAMGNEEEKRMLELRYTDGKAWEDVMRKMSISKTTSFRIHESALVHFLESYMAGKH